MLKQHGSSGFRKILITIMLMTEGNTLYGQSPGQFMLVFLIKSGNHNLVEASHEIENEHFETISRLADQGFLVNANCQLPTSPTFR
ncbi:MAG: hypothetical protein IIB82_05315 [Bacteroidetes bacterium]|nr:hypothetical protein [Bacteroidota bacterium]